MAIKNAPRNAAIKPEEVEQEFLFPDEGVSITATTREEAEKKLRAGAAKKKGA